MTYLLTLCVSIGKEIGAINAAQVREVGVFHLIRV